MTAARSSSAEGHLEQLWAALEAEPSSAYLLAPDLSIQYVNQAFRRFARDNGAAELAESWASARPFNEYIAPPLSELFLAKFRRVLDRREAWSHSYECSSPGVYRKFNMRVESTFKQDGLIVVHSLVFEAPQGSHLLAKGDREQLFTDSRGLIVQCSACGRVRRAKEPSIWDWAPGLVNNDTENVSHGLCVMCDFQYYSSQSPQT